MRRSSCSVVVLLLWSVFESAHAIAPFEWAPHTLVLQAQPGQSLTTTVKVTASAAVDAVSVLPNSALSPFITLAASELPQVTAGDSIDVTLSIRVPFQIASGEIKGTIQIRATETSSRTYAKPLPVTILVVVPTAGQVSVGSELVSLTPPAGWYIVNDAAAGVSALYSPATAQLIDSGTQDAPPDILVSVEDNSAGLSAVEFAGAYRDGKFAEYASSQTQDIAGALALVVNDEVSPAPFQPIHAALIPVGGSMLIVAGYDADPSTFGAVLSSLQAN